MFSVEFLEALMKVKLRMKPVNVQPKEIKMYLEHLNLRKCFRINT